MRDLAKRFRELVDADAAEITVDEIIQTHDHLFGEHVAISFEDHSSGDRSVGGQRVERDRRRRRRVSLLVAAALVVGATVGIAVVAGRSGIGTRIQTTHGPGTKVQQGGATLTLPAGWGQLPTAAASNQILVVGTSAGPAVPCRLNRTRTGSAYVVIAGLAPGSRAISFAGQIVTISSRPARFTLASGFDYAHLGGVNVCAARGAATSRAHYYFFSDAGHNVEAAVMSEGGSSKQLLKQALAVLNTLQLSFTG